MLKSLRKKKFDSTPEAIRKRILDFLWEDHPHIHHLPANELHFFKNLGMDSIDVARLVVHLENTFGIDFDEAEDLPFLSDVPTLTQLTYEMINRGAGAVNIGPYPKGGIQ